jgi:hypothetical protein
MNGLGGSELYHYELLMGLSKYTDYNITFATYTNPNLDFYLYKDLLNNGIKISNLSNIDTDYDLIIASQPGPNYILCNLLPDIPKISIIHSALRSEDAIMHKSIKHYIAVQPDIYRCLKNIYNIKTKNISLIYNPINEDRFKKYNIEKNLDNQIQGVLVGEINDPLRIPMINHIVTECINQNIKLTIISKSKHNFHNNLITIEDECYYTEDYLKYADFTVGLGGRTTIEGWMCNIPSYIYYVNSNGDILDIKLKYPPKIDRFKKTYVAKQHLDLYKQILN